MRSLRESPEPRTNGSFIRLKPLGSVCPALDPYEAMNQVGADPKHNVGARVVRQNHASDVDLQSVKFSTILPQLIGNEHVAFDCLTGSFGRVSHRLNFRQNSGCGGKIPRLEQKVDAFLGQNGTRLRRRLLSCGLAEQPEGFLSSQNLGSSAGVRCCGLGKSPEVTRGFCAAAGVFPSVASSRGISVVLV
jgi:hypothetical protein